MTDMQQSGLDLKVQRIRLDVKGKDLAAAANRHPAWVSRIEARRVVPAEQARVYLEALATLATSTTAQEVA